MARHLQLSTARTAEIWREMLFVRRELYKDSDFFKMPDAWDKVCDGSGDWKVKTYREMQKEDYERRAGVIAFGDALTLTADEQLVENAMHGCMLANFVLAHELGHVALDHHKKGAVIKNFQLFSGPNGASNIPPTVEELEANFAAVFFQCGVALADERWDPYRLAKRACSDPYYVRQASKRVTLEVFKREVRRQETRFPRVIL